MSNELDDKNGWPPLPYAAWAETCTALHLWTQIVGKYRLAHAPWVNHSWHATRYVTQRGLTTGAVPDGKAASTFIFDLHAPALDGETLDTPAGRSEGKECDSTGRLLCAPSPKK